MGILVTEGVRGEGGILTNKNGKRFMFDSIPDMKKLKASGRHTTTTPCCAGTPAPG